MEDIFKFLLVAGILIYGFIKQVRKETPEQPAFPYPEMPDSDEDSFMPEEIPSPQASHLDPVQEMVTPPNKQASPKSAHKKARRHQPIQEPQQTVATSSANHSDESSDYSIHSIEEARRAIIWSEILQRKY